MSIVAAVFRFRFYEKLIHRCKNYNHSDNSINFTNTPSHISNTKLPKIYKFQQLNLDCELLHKKCSILKVELYKPETDK